MAWINILNVIYPVGSVYFSTINTSPASIIGGTWSQLTGGMLGLVGSTGVAAAGSNGGSRKISVNQMPSHTHTFGRRSYGGSFTSDLGWWYSNINDSGSGWLIITGAADGAWGVPEIASTGGGNDYIPAHTAVYAWKRTA